MIRVLGAMASTTALFPRVHVSNFLVPVNGIFGEKKVYGV